jgi:hypothetical protein
MSTKKEPKEKKPTIFAIIGAMSATRPLTYDDLMETGATYEPFLVNRAFSLSADTVLAASLMNLRSHLDKDQQATFLIHSIRPKRRFEKWPKSLKEEDTKTIATYYGMSMREARLYGNLHTSEQISAMNAVLETNGRPSRTR